MAIPITIIIGIFAVILSAYFSRRAWQINLIEEIRVRETDNCIQLLDIFSSTVDQRIAAQRFFISALVRGNPTDEDVKDYREGVRLWLEKINTIRSKIMFYFDYSDVMDFERYIILRISQVGATCESAAASYRSHGAITPEELSKLRIASSTLDTVSARTFRMVYKLQTKVSKENFGTLRIVNDLTIYNNKYVSNLDIIRRILNT